MSTNVSTSNPEAKAFSIRLNELASLRESENQANSAYDSNDKVHIDFKFPDGKTMEAEVRVSQPVDYLKAHLIRQLTTTATEIDSKTDAEAEADFALTLPTVDDIELIWESTEMPDPVSLSDLGIAAGQSIQVVVAYTQEYIQRVTEEAARLCEEDEDEDASDEAGDLLYEGELGGPGDEVGEEGSFEYDDADYGDDLDYEANENVESAE